MVFKALHGRLGPQDAGQSWRKAWGRHHGLHSWIPHPSRRAWALVSWWNGACNKAEKADKEEKGQDDPDKEKATPGSDED